MTNKRLKDFCVTLSLLLVFVSIMAIIGEIRARDIKLENDKLKAEIEKLKATPIREKTDGKN